MDKEADSINPPHYKFQFGGTGMRIETIDYIQAVCQNLPGDESYLAGAVLKYISRYRRKNNPVEDLQKADWYLQRLIKVVQSKHLKEDV